MFKKFGKKNSRSRFILPNWALIIRLILIRDYVTPPAGGSLIPSTSVPKGDSFGFIRLHQDEKSRFSEIGLFIFPIEFDCNFIGNQRSLVIMNVQVMMIVFNMQSQLSCTLISNQIGNDS